MPYVTYVCRGCEKACETNDGGAMPFKTSRCCGRSVKAVPVTERTASTLAG